MRQSPTESATKFKVGTKKRGNDGNMWVITVTKTGVKRWTRHKQKSRSSRSSRQKRSRSSRQKRGSSTSTKTKSRGKTKIAFTEPMIYYDDLKYKSNKFASVTFVVSPKFLEILRKKPKRKDSSTGNAYIFGKKFPQSSYRFLGAHGNDAAQTGFIEYDKWGVINHDDIFGDPWEKAYPKYNWDNRVGLAYIRKSRPGIVWVGETVGGDVGAELWIHETNGEIDSVIVENDCLFIDKHQYDVKLGDMTKIVHKGALKEKASRKSSKSSRKSKKSNRKSPSESATKFNVGTMKRGNDGNMWVIRKTKTGVKRWVKSK